METVGIRNALIRTYGTQSYRFITALLLLGLVLIPVSPPVGPLHEIIVQADDVVTAAALVRDVGGAVTHELGVIDAVVRSARTGAPVKL